MINSKKNIQNLKHQTNHQKKPTYIKLKDKKIIRNFVLMTKTIAKISTTIYLRIIQDKLFVYSNEDCQDQIRYVLFLEKNNQHLELQNKETFCISISNYFAELLDNFLQHEEILSIEIDLQQEKLKLFTDSTIFIIEVKLILQGFVIYKSPEDNYHFKIDINLLEMLKGLSSSNKNISSLFYLNIDKFKFIEEGIKQGEFIVNNKERSRIVVNNNEFYDIIEKFQKMKKNHDITIENSCICIGLSKYFLNYFSLAPSIINNSKNLKKEKLTHNNNANVNKQINHNQHLAFGEKIYFKIKELQRNKDDDGSLIDRGEIRMSAVRKINGKTIEEFYFNSKTELSVCFSNEIFKENYNDFAVLKDKSTAIKNENNINISSFYIFGTSQNPLNVSRVDNNNKIKIDNSLLVNAKIQVDDDQDKDNKSIFDNIKSSHINSDVAREISSDSSNYSMKFLPFKRSMELLVEESIEDSINNYDNNKNNNLIIANSNRNIQKLNKDSNNCKDYINEMSSRGGYDFNNIKDLKNTNNINDINNMYSKPYKINGNNQINHNSHSTKPNSGLNSIYKNQTYHTIGVNMNNPMNMNKIHMDQINQNHKINNNYHQNHDNNNIDQLKHTHLNNHPSFLKSNSITGNINNFNSPFVIDASSIKPNSCINDNNLFSTDPTSLNTMLLATKNNNIKNNPYIVNDNKEPFTAKNIKNPFIIENSKNLAFDTSNINRNNQNNINPFMIKFNPVDRSKASINKLSNNNINPNVPHEFNKNNKNIPYNKNALNVMETSDISRFIKKEE